MKVTIALVFLLSFPAVSVHGASFVSVGSNIDRDPQPAGQMPYEMNGRQEERTPFLTFADCSGWTVESDGAIAFLNRSQEQRMFGHDSGKLTYQSTDANSTMTLLAKDPIAIPGSWDCLSMWVYGNSWQYGDVVGPLDMDIIVKDADGKESYHRFSGYYKGSINYKYWWLLRIKIHQPIAYPATLVGFKFSGRKITYPGKSETIYLGPMYAYKEQLKPLTFEPFPAALPFPTRSETILPLNKTDSFKNKVSVDGSEYVFTYKGADAELAYRVDSKEHGFGGIRVAHKGTKIQPCAGGGIVVAADNNDAGLVTWKQMGRELKDGVLTVKWEAGNGSKTKSISYRYYIRQKSLIVEIEEDASSGGIVKDVQLGAAEGVKSPQLFRIPMLNFDYAEAPRLLYANGLFFFTQFDWYYSQASLFYAKKFLVTSASAVFNGGALYIPRTDGVRNSVQERLFINVSPDVQEVLPTIPNPKSPMQSLMCDKAWLTINCVGMSHEDRLRIPRTFRNLGIENVAVRYHEGTWRDGGESFTFRTDASPKQGGNDALKNMVASVKALGWLCGLYTNYTDFSPVNPTWNEDWLRLDENGDWNSSWYASYSVKPMIAWQEQMKYAPVIHQRYGTDHCYCDVHTAVPPFARVDYDARVPGAATFRKTFDIYGMLMMREREAHKGPVYSEGGNHWWYAGLIDGSYANAFPSLIEQPFFVDFELLKIHPLEMDAGSCADVNAYTAMTLAYGHICQLTPYGEVGEVESMKRYYLIGPIQPYYTMVPVKSIQYWDGKGLVNSSQALTSDSNSQRKVHVEYESGCKIWVNVGKSPWDITVGGKHYILPTNGYYAESPDGKAVSYSAMVADSCDTSKKVWVDLASGPVSHYINTRGGFVSLEKMAGRGSAVLKKEKSGWELIPARDFEEIGFDPSVIGLADVAIEVEALDQNGLPVAPPEAHWNNGKLWVKSSHDKAFKYRLVPAVRVLP